MIKLIALYYKLKLRCRNNARIKTCTTKSLYVGYSNKGWKDVVRVSDHPTLNKNKNQRNHRTGWIQKRFLWVYIDIKKGII